jgi:hypothetical protein
VSTWLENCTTPQKLAALSCQMRFITFFLELDRRSLTAKIEKLDALLSASSEALQGPWWTMPRPIVGLW